MTPDADVTKQYLLGTLPDEASQSVETRLLTDEPFLNDLLIGEDELTDQYLAGALTQEERDQFERHFLSTAERRRKLRFGKSLGQYISQSAIVDEAGKKLLSTYATEPQKHLSWLDRFGVFQLSHPWVSGAALASLIVAVIVCGVWLLRDPTPRTFAALTLTAGAGNRAENTQSAVVKLPLGADALRIDLRLPDELAAAKQRRVEAVFENGRTVNLNPEKIDGQLVRVVIPSSELQRGQYALRLFVTTSDGAEQRVSGSYFFTVE